MCIVWYIKNYIYTGGNIEKNIIQNSKDCAANTCKVLLWNW